MTQATSITTVLVLSEHDRSSGGFCMQDSAHSYVVGWIRNPDPGSEFAAAAAQLQSLQDGELYRRLRTCGYDGLLFFVGAEIVGHIFFQRVDDCNHLFSMFLAPDLRGQRMSGQMVLRFIELSREQGASRLRFGKGVHPKMQAVARFLARRSEELRLQVEEAGYVALQA